MSKLTRTKALITGATMSLMLTGCASSSNSDAVNALSIKTSSDTVTPLRKFNERLRRFKATKYHRKLLPIRLKRALTC
jgi:ABC-type uncharacterized transport system auxiliary subunit